MKRTTSRQRQRLVGQLMAQTEDKALPLQMSAAMAEMALSAPAYRQLLSIGSSRLPTPE